MMNGGIEVDSTPGKGSTFVARIWLENDEAQAPVSLEERFRHLKALVVDADAEELEYTCSLLFRFEWPLRASLPAIWHWSGWMRRYGRANPI